MTPAHEHERVEPASEHEHWQRQCEGLTQHNRMCFSMRSLTTNHEQVPSTMNKYK